MLYQVHHKYYSIKKVYTKISFLHSHFLVEFYVYLDFKTIVKLMYCKFFWFGFLTTNVFTQL